MKAEIFLRLYLCVPTINGAYQQLCRSHSTPSPDPKALSVCVCVHVCVPHKIQCRDEEQSKGWGRGSGIAKVSVALSVIYRHITRLTQLVCACAVRDGVRSRCECEKAGLHVNMLRVSAPIGRFNLFFVFFVFFPPSLAQQQPCSL